MNISNSNLDLKENIQNINDSCDKITKNLLNDLPQKKKFSDSKSVTNESTNGK